MNDRAIACKTGYEIVAQTLSDWGIRVCAGVTGGGVIHLLKHLQPLDIGSDTPGDGLALFTIGEYAASFVPLGSYLASGQIGAVVATTGAATRLITCSLSDAKMHDIPAVYLIPLSSTRVQGCAPLQDTSAHGSNVVVQLQAELPTGVFVLNDPAQLSQQLALAQAELAASRPVVLVLDPDALNLLASDLPAAMLTTPDPLHTPKEQFAQFQTLFAGQACGRRVVILAGEEAARYHEMPQLTRRLCELLHAPIVWSINGSNAVARDNPYGYGYIAFGGNDHALALFNSLGPEDVLVTLGFCPDEYTLNLQQVPVGTTWNFTNLPQSYGRLDGTFQHRVSGQFHEVIGDMAQSLQAVIHWLEQDPVLTLPVPVAPDDLNTRVIRQPRRDCVDLAFFYQALEVLWQPGSVGFDDVCLAYKDRQYITQRPHPHIRFHAMYRGSAMGGAFGLGVGACLATPSTPVFVFTGDGCFRLFGACLAEARALGLVLFVLNNQSYAIVEQGLPAILPDVEPAHYHARLDEVDFCAIARAQGWRSVKLNADLSNLASIMAQCHCRAEPSILIEVPVDPAQEVGRNPRVRNL